MGNLELSGQPTIYMCVCVCVCVCVYSMRTMRTILSSNLIKLAISASSIFFLVASLEFPA